MKKSIISAIIGLPIGIISALLAYNSFFIYGVEGIVIYAGFLILYYHGWFLTFPLLILGLILGIKGLKEKSGKVISYVGILANTISLIIGVLVLIIPPVRGYFYDRGLVVNKEVQGVLFSKGTKVEAYPSGKLMKVELIADQKIHGIMFSKNKPVSFYESGKVREGRLAENQEIQCIDFLKGTDIEFDESGKLDSAYLKVPHDIYGIKCVNYVSFDESGKLRAITLAEDHKIEGIVFLKGTYVNFDESGRISYVTLKSGQEINGTRYSNGQRLQFGKDGNIKPPN